MLAELFDRLRESTKAEETPQLVKIEGLRRKALVAFQGKITDYEIPPPARWHRVLSAIDFVAWLATHPLADVFHNESGVSAWLDREQREDTIHMPLAMTSQFSELLQLQTPLSLEPKKMLSFMRLKLRTAVPAQVTQSLRKIDFIKIQTGKSSVERGRESLGRNVEAAVQQIDEIPRSFTVSGPFFSTPGLTGHYATIEVFLEVDVDEQTIELSVDPDEAREAISRAQEYVREVLLNASPSVRVTYGHAGPAGAVPQPR